MNRYRNIRTLSYGLALTQLAEDSATGREVILKRCQKTDSLALHQQSLEAEILLNLNGDGAPVLYGFEENETERILIQEFITGTRAPDLNRMQKRELLKQLTVHLRKIHSLGYLYLDLKETHLFLRNGKLVLIDYDGALETGNRECFFGTPGNMAPELLSDRPKDEKADVYAWGVLAREWHLFGIRRRKCLSADPNRRPAPEKILTVCNRTFLAICIAVSVFAAGLCMAAGAENETVRESLSGSFLSEMNCSDAEKIGILENLQDPVDPKLFRQLCSEVMNEEQARIMTGYSIRMLASGIRYPVPDEWEVRFGNALGDLLEIRRKTNDRQNTRPDTDSRFGSG